LFYDDAGRNECDQKLATTMKATYQSGTNLSTPGVSQWVTSVLQTMDGASYYILACGIEYGGIYVDVNGQAGPNVDGKDIFWFFYDRYDNNRKKQLTYSLRPASGTCTKTSYSEYCTAQVLETGKMDYLN
jgi:hypothetical protein